ncbi:unnamed protein product [Linum tenue]|uniref:Uncharacterized protein n=1 Tax=Linum tenue TaxID=586396 RepID=A0AAV0LSY1_9ROSI|nr:unnamed protein product [Linum tenue]
MVSQQELEDSNVSGVVYRSTRFCFCLPSRRKTHGGNCQFQQVKINHCPIALFIARPSLLDRPCSITIPINKKNCFSVFPFPPSVCLFFSPLWPCRRCQASFAAGIIVQLPRIIITHRRRRRPQTTCARGTFVI